MTRAAATDDTVQTIALPVPSRRDSTRARSLELLSAVLAESTNDAGDVMQRMVQLIASFLGDTAIVRLLADGQITEHVDAAADEDPAVCDLLVRAVSHLPAVLDGRSPHAQAVHAARPVLVTDGAFQEMLTVAPADLRRRLDAIRLHTVLVCPLRVRNEIIGTLGLWRRGTKPPFSQRDQSFAQECADRTALAIENSRLRTRLEREIEQTRATREDLRLSAELLHRADENRRTLMAHLVSAQEDERRRIAVDVHDESIQAMAAIGLRLQVLRRHIDDPAVADRIAEIEDTVTESIGRLRSLLFRLESSSLEKAGLARTITRYAAELFPDGKPAVHMRNRLQVEPPSVLQLVLYRVAQEALTNIRKHANAAEVTVTLSTRGGEVILAVRDDGDGFDPEQIASRALPGHLGLRGMDDRARMGGGSLRVTSAPREGTTVECSLPLSEFDQA